MKNATKIAIALVFAAFMVGIGLGIYHKIQPGNPCDAELMDTGIHCTLKAGHTSPHVNKGGFIWALDKDMTPSLKGQD